MKLNSLPIFNPINNTFLFYKNRSLIHKEGDWHNTIQANIIRKNNSGTYDILVQQRSLKVDIGHNKLDQSLATQMCFVDKLSPELTLKRGLLSELGINDYEFIKIPYTMFIIKTYKNQPKILNRELLNLYIVKIENNCKARISTPKIKKLYWMEWNKFLLFFKKNKKNFTKTSQFYFSNPKIISNIKKNQYNFLCTNKKINRNINNKYIFHINKSNQKNITYFFDTKEIQKYSYLFKEK